MGDTLVRIINYPTTENVDKLIATPTTLTANNVVKAVSTYGIDDCVSLREEVDGTVKVGTLVNYVQFSPAGHMTLVGLATTFNDLLGDVTRIKVVGVGIQDNSTESAIDFLTSANLSDYVYANFQLSHSWNPGSTLHPHIHFEQTEDNVPNFLIQYRWQVNGGAKTTAWTDMICNTPVFDYISGTLNQIAKGVGIPAPLVYNISDILQIKIYRDNSNASLKFAGLDPFTTTAVITSADIHFEINDLGSNTEYNK